MGCSGKTQFSVLPVSVPSLRERSAADIQAMAKYCLNQSVRARCRNITEISSEFLAHVSRYGWLRKVWEGKKKVAQMLGIATLYRKLKEYKL